MPEFKNIQQNLTAAKNSKTQKGRDLLLAQERLQKLQRKQATQRRGQVLDEHTRNEWRQQEESARDEIVRATTALQEISTEELEWLGQFADFTDPREHLGQHQDDTPILLFPIRLETRFKQFADTAGALRHQLWVRVFPDECSVDTFEDILSESEIRKVRDYWINLWSAGSAETEPSKTFIFGQQKAAWNFLAGSFQAGRAYWLTQNYQPVNLQENDQPADLSKLPARNHPNEVHLVIPCEEIPAQSDAILDYWRAYWLAGSDRAAQSEAFAAFAATVADAALAEELRKEYIPANLGSVIKPIVQVHCLTASEITDFRPPTTGEVLIFLQVQNTQPTPEQRTALAAYWTAVWLANGNASAQIAALTLLEATIGGSAAAAQELLGAFPAHNLDDVLPPFPPRASFIQFPKTEDTDSRLSNWTQAARISTFPERFVLLGYEGTDSEDQPIEVVSEIGNIIPDPLIIGPNPSMDSGQELSRALIETYQSLTAQTEKEVLLAKLYTQLSKTARLTYGEENDFISSFTTLSDEAAGDRLKAVFADLRDDVKAARYIEYLCRNADTKWLFDFEEAVKIGMGFKVDISPNVYANGFDRLLVMGVKIATDEAEGRAELEQLLRNHHYGSSGFSILPQGTPTNNTETTDSGYTEEEDTDDSYDRYHTIEAMDVATDDFSKLDGQWLSELLGIDDTASSLRFAEYYTHTDQCEARAMNTALWNATFGYYIENMIPPVLGDREEAVLHELFVNHVSGRGGLPAFRIGDQPYGILPVSQLTATNWLHNNKDNLLNPTSFGNSIHDLQKIYGVLREMRTDFSTLLDQVAYVGKAGDPHAILLEVLGLHATSVEFKQRYAESFGHLYNYLVATGAFDNSNIVGWLGSFFKRLFSGGMIATSSDKLGLTNNQAFNSWLEGVYKDAGLDLLRSLGFDPGEKEVEIPMLEKFFFTQLNHINKPLIDDQPLSEQKPVRPYAEPPAEGEAPLNYLAWLAKYAREDFAKIKNQEGFLGNKKPGTLLYEMLRHSLTLAFSNKGLQLYQQAEVLDAQQVAFINKDADFVAIKAEESIVGSKWDYLEQVVPQVATGITVAAHVSRLIELQEAFRLNVMVRSLEHLAETPTARLERAFAEHLDLCSYRLDAWLLSFVRLQLQSMRRRQRFDEDGNELDQGTYLGAYGWVEDLRPDNTERTPAEIPSELQSIFDEDDIMTDSDNGGYIHAPSVSQALTAAVLRNAYFSTADVDNADIYKVNLSSERVRLAMAIIQGMQQGQGLGALLGYQLERGLHERANTNNVELDAFIYELRKHFPLVAGHNTQTDPTPEETAELDGEEAISKIEASNVLDGLALIRHMQENNTFNYPFNIPTGQGYREIKAASSTERGLIDAEVGRLRNINDAVADLALAESVHQVVQANYDRASAALTAFSKGSFPQTPEVVRTPRSGINITHRFGIHLDPTSIAPADSNARVLAEPSLDEWLAGFLPTMMDIQCKVALSTPAYAEDEEPQVQEVTVSLADLGLSPIDLLYMLDPKEHKELTALDEHIVHFVQSDNQLRPDIQIQINYTAELIDSTKYSIFQITAIVTQLRALVLSGRPLRDTDVLLPHESKSVDAQASSVDANRVNAAFASFVTIHTNFRTELLDKLDDPTDFGRYFVDGAFDYENHSPDSVFLAALDDFKDDYLGILANLAQFGIPEAGFGYIYDRHASIYHGIYQHVFDYHKRWAAKVNKFTTLIAASQEIGIADAERKRRLREAERTISTQYTIKIEDLPGTGTALDNYQNYLANDKAPDFYAKQVQINDWLVDSFSSFDALITALNQLKAGAMPLIDFDLQELDTAEQERLIVVLAEDIAHNIRKLYTVLDKLKIKVEQSLADYAATEDINEQTELLTQVLHLLFGEDFKVIPSFNWQGTQAIELQQTAADQSQLLDFQQQTKGADFPVDNWLYGIARVRERMANWERLVLLTDGIAGTPPELIPIQLPYQENDSWLALEYPESYEINSDKLLYTAFAPGFDSGNKQCGLLIDEWTETIPTRTETTGLSFQYDQPNAEPPQSLLLVTPTSFKDQWEWGELVGAVHEALDLAKLRAIEPEQIGNTPYGQFLPATVAATTRYPLMTMTLNYVLNEDFLANANTN